MANHCWETRKFILYEFLTNIYFGFRFPVELEIRFSPVRQMQMIATLDLEAQAGYSDQERKL